MSKKRGGSTPGSPENQARKREERKAQARKKRRRRLLMALSIVALTAVAAGAGITLFNRRDEAVRDTSSFGLRIFIPTRDLLLRHDTPPLAGLHCYS